MERITERQLDRKVGLLNKLTGHETPRYNEAGVYVLDFAYGGVGLHRYIGTSGGVEDIFGGHMPKRELYGKICAYIAGIEAGRE